MKDKLTAGPTVSETPSEDLQDAVATFAFSRLEKRNRIALILAGIFGGEAEQYLDKADEIAYYGDHDFAVPYKARA